MSGRRKTGVAAMVFAVLLLVGAFVVYPAVAAPIAKERVEDGIQSVAKASDVKLEDVVVDVSGGNAFAALFTGKQVGDISVRIGKIVLPEGAVSGGAPEVTSGQERRATDGVRELLDAIESVGSFELAVGGALSGTEKLALNYSSFRLTDDKYRLVLRVPQDDVARVIKPIGISLNAVASDSTISGDVTLGDPGSEFSLKEDFKIDVKPVDGGRAVSASVNGGPAEKFQLGPDRATVNELRFSTANGAYEVAVGGEYNYEALRALIEKDLSQFSAGQK